MDSDRESLIPGIVMNDLMANEILEKICTLCEWNFSLFPGSQPMSLNRSSLVDFEKYPFLVCEKSDGERCLLFLATNRAFLINRLEEVKTLSMFFPLRHNPSVSHQVTLLDGEIVNDIVTYVNENNETITQNNIRYLVYDAICVHGVSLINLNLLDRLAFAYSNVIKPRIKYEKENPMEIQNEKDRSEYIEIYLKDFYEIWDIHIIQSYIPKLLHASDGFIFTNVIAPYIPGTTNSIYKWKEKHLNTVDFIGEFITMERSINSSYHNTSGECSSFPNKVLGIRLFTSKFGYKTNTNQWLSLESKNCQNLIREFEEGNSSLDDTVLECFYDFNAISIVPKINILEDNSELYDFSNPENKSGSWCFERVRLDKKAPNDENVMLKIIETIRQSISFDELVKKFEEIKQSGRARVTDLCKFADYSSYKKNIYLSF